MKSFKEWVVIREAQSWTADRKKIKTWYRQAKCRRCEKVYNVYNLTDFFEGGSRCPDCGGQGDLMGDDVKPWPKSKMGVVSARPAYGDDLSRLPGQVG